LQVTTQPAKKGEKNMSDCEKSETSGQTSKSQTECGPGGLSCCPIETAAQKWSGSFCQAMTEVQVEILKQRIKKAWGAEMEKIGDAVVESMGAQWQAILTQAKAHVDLRENIKKVFCSEKH
jgi:hypothetical protein